MPTNTFGQRVFDFYTNLGINSLPDNIQVMNPHKSTTVQKYTHRFLTKFFSDNNKRFLVFGINPGRFGAGITGVTFTDPHALNKHCGIKNDLPKARELSTDFIYQFINSWGGAGKFYSEFFLTAVSPLGFTKDGINYNYYDDKKLEEATTPFIVESIQKQIELGSRQEAAILIGTGKNQKFFTKLNQKHNFFKEIYAVEHPRFILQYKRKHVTTYLQKYHQTFSKVLAIPDANNS